MGLFSRERKVFFKHKCADENGELVKRKILNKVSESDCVITAEMIEGLLSYPELEKEITKILSVSSQDLLHMIIIDFGTFTFPVKVSKTTKVIIHIVPVDEIRDSPFSDIKVIGFIYKKKSTDQEIERISEWMLEFKALCDQMSKHNELLQKG
ncbi:hypothetical protein QUF99_13780 [Bacillus sp. DX4.1]|uniref:hypothetical protein n=1 Tax=Bacillus sp. DX4.1 TaxID=3055867 RepID=UPI0025A259C4|nr:hypothetical protein [Bacillus sp. DX4.1]MDM5188350.1 hypothetical protein [Bacillus sp. DX4.1]